MLRAAEGPLTMHHQQARESGPAVAAELITDLVHRGSMAQVVYVAAELGLADLLLDGPLQAEAIARASGCHAPSLHRLLRALVIAGLLIETGDGAFTLSDAGRCLAMDTDRSLRPWLLWFGRHQWSVWSGLLDTVRTGESARKRMTGRAGMSLFDKDPQTAALFNAAMATLARQVASEVAARCDLTDAQLIVDVGGGHGVLLEAILRANEQARGILFDRPHVMDGARALLQRAGVADRCMFVTGDFFVSIPARGDVYLLKSIIHDWDDECAEAILHKCREAMTEGSRLLLIERVVPERLQACAFHRALAHADLTMMLGPGGRERTTAEYERLLSTTGLRLVDTIALVSGFSILLTARAA
jgi:hypothetical protein